MPTYTFFIFFVFLTCLPQAVFGQDTTELTFSWRQLYPFLHGFLFVGFGYTLLFFFLTRSKLWGYVSISLGIFSLVFRFYTNFTLLSIVFHVFLLILVVFLVWRLALMVRPLKSVQEKNIFLESKIAQQVEEIAHERANLYAVMESTPDLIYSLDKDLRFITMNSATRKAFNFFYHKNIDVGSYYKEVVAPEVLQLLLPYFEKAFSGAFLKEKISHTFQGKPYYRELYINPIREKNGTISSISIFSEDITESELGRQNLQYTESLLEATFAQSPDALFLVNLEDFVITRCNRRALELYEADDEDDMMGRAGTSLHKIPLSEAERQEIRESIDNKGLWTNEYEYTTFKGNHFWGILKVSSMLLGNTKVLLSRVSDITERKRNEMKIISKEASLRAILESNDQSIWLVDENFVLIDYNQIFVEMQERTFGIAVTPHMNLIKHLPYVYETMWKSRYKRVIKGQREEYTDVYDYKGKEYVYQITGFPVYEEGMGMPTRGSFFARDITAQVMAERELRSNQLLLASINQHLEDALFRSTPSGRVLYANHGFMKMFGYDEAEAYKQDMRDFYDNHETRLKLQALLEKKQHFANQECLMKRKDGSNVWVSISATQNYDEAGDVYYDGIIRNITEARKAKIQLKKQNKKLKKVNGELDKFVYSASHDLRAPLSSLLGLLDLFRLLDSEEEKKNILDMMIKSVKKLDEFINQIILYSRNSRIEVKPERIDFADLLEGVSDALKYMPESEKILHILDMHVEAPFYSDYFRLSVILNNLVSNAIRYANLEQEKPFVKVLIQADKEKAFIEVSDNGQGIGDEFLPHIFKMFYRANEKNTGSGIGLYILKETLDVLKGKINVTSKLGEGTTFSIEIPNLVPIEE